VDTEAVREVAHALDRFVTSLAQTSVAPSSVATAIRSAGRPKPTAPSPTTATLFPTRSLAERAIATYKKEKSARTATGIARLRASVTAEDARRHVENPPTCS